MNLRVGRVWHWIRDCASLVADVKVLWSESLIFDKGGFDEQAIFN